MGDLLGTASPQVGTTGLFRFFLPEVICGPGALAEVGHTALRLGAHRVLAVTDPDAVRAGWTAELYRHLEQAGLLRATWNAISVRPQSAEIAAAVQTYHTSGCDVIVAIGGRAAMDVAKAVAVLSSNGGCAADYDGFGRVTQPTPPTVMIPTAFGTGAEVVQSCVVDDRSRGSVVTMLGCAFVADVALVDPGFVAALSPRLLAASGFDTLAMALEGYLSPTATAMTDPHALTAMRLISDRLALAVGAAGVRAAVDHGVCDQEVATALSMAGLHAGVAFTNVLQGVTDLLAHPLADLLGLPGGLVKGILLPHVIQHGSRNRDDRYRAAAEAVGLRANDASDDDLVQELAHRVRALADEVGIPSGLAEFGVTHKDLDMIARQVTSGQDTWSNLYELSFEYASGVMRAAL